MKTSPLSNVRVHSILEVWFTFLKLGLTSFGGPIAHIGYFRQEIVVRRRWMDDGAYTDLVALCQFLPGPASSQVGFSVGLIRAGYWGGLAAWFGFTMPSAILLSAFAYGVGVLGGPISEGALHGLKLVAVAVVAQAVLGMARTLCPDRTRASIAAIAALIVLSSTSFIAQLGAILTGGIAGLLLCKSAMHSDWVNVTVPITRPVGIMALSLFFLALIGLPALSHLSHGIELFNAFYRSGALVFGGGHVVLPLLSNAFVAPGWVNNDDFLAGYGAAQAVPGPLFSFAAYLGALAFPWSNAWQGAVLGIVGIFLPGMLVLLGALPFWQKLQRQRGARATVQGVNAAVVGLLGAALYSPLWTSAVKSSSDFAAVLVGFIALAAWQAPPLAVVVCGALIGISLTVW
jgi:chromate transporter